MGSAPASISRWSLAGWFVGPAALLVATEVARVHGVSNRLLFGLAASLGAMGVARLVAQRARIDLARIATAGGLLGAVSVAVAWAPQWFAAADHRALAEAALPAFMATALLGWMPWCAPASQQPWEPPRGTLVAAWLLCTGSILWAEIAVVGPFPEITDEASYLLQSGWMRFPDFSWHIDPALAEFFVERHLVYRSGQLASQYPPGWPAVLALFDVIGLRNHWGSILGPIALLLTYGLGRSLAGHRSAVLSALLLASSQWFIVSFAGYMSHGLSMLVTLVAAWALVAAESRVGLTRFAAIATSGFALGCALCVRPLTGATLALGILCWRWIATRPRWPQLAMQVLALGIGAFGPLAWLLYFNACTTGSPLLFGYAAAHGELHSIGFGPRGFMVYEEGTLTRVPHTWPFSPVKALANFASTLAQAAHGVLALFAGVPILAVAYVNRIRIGLRWFPLLSLPFAYFFYWFTEVRFWMELLPLLCIGVAAWLTRVLDGNRALGAALFGILALGQGAFAIAPSTRPPYYDEPWTRYHQGLATRSNFEAVEQLRNEHGRILVFAGDDIPHFDPLFDRLMFYNRDGDAGDVLVARDLSDRNAELIRRHPDRRAFRFRRTDATAPATITPL